MAHIPGTIYPIGGRPHTPDLCSHRDRIRRNFRGHTALCYSPGEYTIVSRTTGESAKVSTAEGLIDLRFCAKHIDHHVRSYGNACDKRHV